MKYQINLASAQHKEKPVDRIIYFSLHYLRYILVMTQIVVIGVFLYKFQVDQKIVDLTEAAQQKKEIINVSTPLVKEVKAIDFSINQSKQILGAQDDYTLLLQYLLSGFPIDFFLKKLEIQKNSINFSGTTTNVKTLKAYFIHLQHEKKFKQISLKNIIKKENGLEFAFELKDFQPQ